MSSRPPCRRAAGGGGGGGVRVMGLWAFVVTHPSAAAGGARGCVTLMGLWPSVATHPSLRAAPAAAPRAGASRRWPHGRLFVTHLDGHRQLLRVPEEPHLAGLVDHAI